MSTRATYQFIGGTLPAPITVYIHHDGYPEGAACYFWNMHECERRLGHFERFLIANERAEVTDSHEAHGDTEYRYTLEGDELTAWKRYGYGDGATWQVFYVGAWWDFVNKYGPEGFDGFEPLRQVGGAYWGNGNKCVYTRTQLVKALEEKERLAAAYREKFPEMKGNQGWNDEEIARARKRVEEFDALNKTAAA